MKTPPLIPCPACQQSISASAPACPHCGQPAKKKSGCASGIVMLVIIIITAVVAGKVAIEADKQPPPPPLVITATGTGSVQGSVMTITAGKSQSNSFGPVKLPYTWQFPAGVTVSISAQKDAGDTSKLTLTATKGGQTVSETSTSAPHGVVTLAQ